MFGFFLFGEDDYFKVPTLKDCRVSLVLKDQSIGEKLAPTKGTELLQVNEKGDKTNIRLRLNLGNIFLCFNDSQFPVKKTKMLTKFFDHDPRIANGILAGKGYCKLTFKEEPFEFTLKGKWDENERAALTPMGIVEKAPFVKLREMLEKLPFKQVISK